MVEYTVKEIEEKDLENGFLDTLNCFRPIGNLKGKRAIEILQKIKSNPNHKIFVAVKNDGKVIGTTTMLIEPKFIHEGGVVGHIEDVATHKNYRDQGVGSALMQKAVEIAKQAGCYKVILDCGKENVPFYQKLGFKKHEIEMRLDLR